MAEKETPVEEVSKLYQMGLNDSDVIRRLTEEGYSPVQISDALNQAKIKQEIELSDIKPLSPPPALAQMKAPQQPVQARQPILPPLSLPPKMLSAPVQATMPSPPQAMNSQPAPQMQQQRSPATMATEIPVPKPSAVAPVPVPQPKSQKQGAPMQGRPQPSDESSGYPYSYPTYPEEQVPQKVETEAIEEIAEEIIDEKWQEIKGRISDVIEWKNYADRRINSIDERIKRVESSIDRLQAALLSKVNEYGRGIKDLGSDVNSLENTLGKLLSPLVDNVKELGRITEDLKTSSGGAAKKNISKK